MSTADAPKKPRETDDVPVPATLRKSLKNRHIQLIALGGAIGTGLFYGSSESIALAGPSILLAYLVGGFAIFMIVRALSEMSVEDPKAGAFSYYATRYWSKRAGFISGWNYWFNYILVSMVELSVVGKFVNYWFPAIPTWVSAAVFLVIICAANLLGVSKFGEFEFWFAIIKIVAVIAMIVGIFVKKIRKLFPPVITGTVVFTIGLSLYPTAIHYMAGGSGNTYDLVVAQKGLSEALVYGSWQNWAVAIFTLIVVMLLSNHGKGICKLASILLGMAAGYAVAAVMGMVDLSEISNAKWFSLPRFLHFGITFEPSACVALGLLFAINSVQAIGDLTATTVGGLNREPTDRELQGGIIAYGATNILTALFGGLPTATYSQNVGIVTTNKVINRTVFALAGGFLLLAGVVPKFSAILTTIPQCVLGGATVTVFSTIAMTGMKLIASEGISPRNTTIVGLSAALGVGISQASAALSQFPEAITVIFGKSPVVIATLLAVILNLILPKENDKLTNAEPVDKPE